MNFSGSIKLKPIGLLILFGFILLLYVISYIDHKSSEDSTINLKDLLTTAIHAAEQGGASIRLQNSNFNKKSKGRTKEGTDEYVTDADRRSHCIMYDSLRTNFPTLKIISEEDVSLKICRSEGFLKIEKPSNSYITNKLKGLNDVYVSINDVTVWIDPLDATQEFTEHLLEYVTTMVCVAIKGQPAIGVIHQPFHKEMITSWAWKPFAMSSDLRVKTNLLQVERNNQIIIVSRSHAGEVDKLVKSVFPGAHVISAGGAGYKVLQLIEGNASIYLHVTAIKKWDVCAGDAILRTVGGRMSTLQNEDINYLFKTDRINHNGILASLTSHKELYQQFKKLVTDKNGK